MLTGLPDELTPLDFAYDWVAQTVYIVGRNTRGSSLQLWTVFDLMPEPAFLMTLNESVPADIEITAIVNPYRGYVN